jgi:glycosyltransferase involved in cell wall biosynthesis
LLLSDDITRESGVANISREIVMATCHRYNWLQIGALINHPNKGKIINVSESIKEATGVEDPFVEIIPYANSYGDAKLVYQIFSERKIDMVIHFTDPRYWQWLYDMSYFIRQNCPLVYYHVWDNDPTPIFNKGSYLSDDAIITISRLTNMVVKDAIKDRIDEVKLYHIPHGVNPNVFYPMLAVGDQIIEQKNGDVTEVKSIKDIYDNLALSIVSPSAYNSESFNERKFVLMFNSRNIYRKKINNLLFAWSNFIESYVNAITDVEHTTREDVIKEIIEGKRYLRLFLRTEPLDQNGTNINKVIKDNLPDYVKKTILLFGEKINTNILNFLYNFADYTINTSNAEGFGLSTAESLMAGTPIIATVTGGLQDQLGFDIDEDMNLLELTKNNSSLSKREILEFDNNWAIPMRPSRSLNGSMECPYIYDDNVDIKEIGNAIALAALRKVKNPESYRNNCRKFALKNFNSHNMGDQFITTLDEIFENWKPVERINISKI